MKGVTRMIKVRISVIVFWPFKADNTEIIIRCLMQSTTTTFLLVHLSIVVTAKKSQILEAHLLYLFIAMKNSVCVEIFMLVSLMRKLKHDYGLSKYVDGSMSS